MSNFIPDKEVWKPLARKTATTGLLSVRVYGHAGNDAHSNSDKYLVCIDTGQQEIALCLDYNDYNTYLSPSKSVGSCLAFIVYGNFEIDELLEVLGLPPREFSEEQS